MMGEDRLRQIVREEITAALAERDRAIREEDTAEDRDERKRWDYVKRTATETVAARATGVDLRGNTTA